MKLNIRQRRKSSFIMNTGEQLFQFKLLPPQPSSASLHKTVQTYNSYSHQQIKNILQSFIDLHKFRKLVCNATNLNYLYEPILSCLEEQYGMSTVKIKVRHVVEIVVEGRFYRKLPKDGLFNLVQYDKSTGTNASSLVASLLVYVSTKLNLAQIEHVLKVFQFQQKLGQTQLVGISLDNQKLSKVLKRLQRCIKPMQFKQWLQDFKATTNSDRLENFQFLYLVSLTQKKVQENGYTFMNINKVKQHTTINQINDSEKENKKHQVLKNHKSISQDQKCRIKSFSYKISRQSLPVIANFKGIKNKIKSSTDKLSQKKKSLGILGRIQSRCINLNENKQIGVESKYKPSRSSSLVLDKEIQNSFRTKHNKLSNQIPLISITRKPRKIVLAPNRKNLVLNAQERRINQNFLQIQNYNEKNIARLMNNLNPIRQLIK